MSPHVELLNEYRAKIVLNENISTPIDVEYEKVNQSKLCVAEFWYLVSGLDDVSNLRTTILHAKKWFQVARYNE